MSELGITWGDAALVVVTATGVYVGMIVLSRWFGQRKFTTASSYDFPFVFAIGSIVGRAVLVKTTLSAALLGLTVMFVLHAVTAWLHHHVGVLHRLSQNRPILLAAHGELLADGLARAHTSALEVYEAVRLAGLGSLDGVAAVVLERNGDFSVIPSGESIEPALWDEVRGNEWLERRPG